MDLIRKLRKWALAHPRVLLVDAPGAGSLRWAAESEVDRRGWALAESPSDTDLLIVLGAPGSQLSAAVEVLWGQVPEPRHRLHIADEQQLHELLAVAARDLVRAAEDPPNVTPQSLASVTGTDAGVDTAIGAEHAREPAGHGGGGQPKTRTTVEAIGEPTDQSDHEAVDHGAADPVGHAAHRSTGHAAHGSMGHAAHGATGDGAHGATDHGPMGHAAHHGPEHVADGGGHEGHHMHHGGEVAGLPMAETGPDRDGLQLDVLGACLGPVLPGWPTGLVLATRLQGDVVTDARLHWLDDGTDGHALPVMDPQRTALDRLASLLWVAGWYTLARAARRARDGLGSADPDERATAAKQAKRVARRVRCSRSLMWTVRGVERLRSDHAGADGDPVHRIRRWCDVAAEGGNGDNPVTTLEDLAAALTGTELATARLIVASVALGRTARSVTAEPSHA